MFAPWLRTWGVQGMLRFLVPQLSSQMSPGVAGSSDPLAQAAGGPPGTLEHWLFSLEGSGNAEFYSLPDSTEGQKGMLSLLAPQLKKQGAQRLLGASTSSLGGP